MQRSPPRVSQELPQSPCIGACRLNERGFCAGCGRSIDEIVAWPEMTAQERREVIERLDSKAEE
ncbi:hypothetical protein BH24PSE2_BH24PSE2_16700 [soil metagenome]